jgi:hypothetical protein
VPVSPAKVAVVCAHRVQPVFPPQYVWSLPSSCVVQQSDSILVTCFGDSALFSFYNGASVSKHHESGACGDMAVFASSYVINCGDSPTPSVTSTPTVTPTPTRTPNAEPYWTQPAGRSELFAIWGRYPGRCKHCIQRVCWRNSKQRGARWHGVQLVPMDLGVGRRHWQNAVESWPSWATAAR